MPVGLIEPTVHIYCEIIHCCTGMQRTNAGTNRFCRSWSKKHFLVCGHLP